MAYSILFPVLLLLYGQLHALKDNIFTPPFMMQPIPSANGIAAFEVPMQPQATHNNTNSVDPACTTLDQQRIRQCADPLYSIGAFSGDGDEPMVVTWEQFVTRTHDYFGQVCDNFYIFDMCIEPYKDICFSRDPVRQQYQTAIKILDFLCRDGYAEMVRNFECFSRTLTRAEMMQCQAEMVADTRKIPSVAEIGPNGQQAAICGAVRNYVDCIKLPIRYECGYRAWHLVREANCDTITTM